MDHPSGDVRAQILLGKTRRASRLLIVRLLSLKTRTFEDVADWYVDKRYMCLAVANESVQLSACADGTFCPRAEQDVNTTCCNDHLGQRAEQGQARIPESVVSSIRATSKATSPSALHTDATGSPIALATASLPTVSTSPSKSTSTSTYTPASSSASPPAFTSSSASEVGLSQSEKIGVAIGISFGSLLIAVLSYMAFRLYRARIQALKEEAARMKESREQYHPTRELQRYEMNGAGNPQEMYTLLNTHEVEAPLHNTHEVEAIAAASRS